MRVTNSRDGVRRATLRIEHRVGREDLIRLLSLWASREVDWREEAEEEMASRTKVLAEAKTILTLDGTSTADYWADDIIDEGEVDEITAWATETVDRLFPEFGGAG